MRHVRYDQINNLAKEMQRNNRNLIEADVYKYGSYDARSAKRLRDGINNNGAVQMMGLMADSGGAVVGVTSSSLTVT